MGNVNMEAYQIHYRGDESVADHLRKIDLDVEKAAALPDLPTTEGKTVLTAITDSQGDTELTYEAPEVESEDIAPAFSEEVAYSEGDLVYYDGILYKFAADHTAGVWDPSEVTQTSAAAEISELKNTLTNPLTKELIAQASLGNPGQYSKPISNYKYLYVYFQGGRNCAQIIPVPFLFNNNYTTNFYLCEQSPTDYYSYAEVSLTSTGVTMNTSGVHGWNTTPKVYIYGCY